MSHTEFENFISIYINLIYILLYLTTDKEAGAHSTYTSHLNWHPVMLYCSIHWLYNEKKHSRFLIKLKKICHCYMVHISFISILMRLSGGNVDATTSNIHLILHKHFYTDN